VATALVTTTAELASLEAFDLIAISSAISSVYSSVPSANLAPAAKETAFDVLEEEFVVEFVEDNKQFSASTSGSTRPAPAQR